MHRPNTRQPMIKSNQQFPLAVIKNDTFQIDTSNKHAPLMIIF